MKIQKQYNGYKIIDGTAYAKGERMTKYPSTKTIRKLKEKGVKDIVWKNGDFMYL